MSNQSYNDDKIDEIMKICNCTAEEAFESLHVTGNKLNQLNDAILHRTDLQKKLDEEEKLAKDLYDKTLKSPCSPMLLRKLGTGPNAPLFSLVYRDIEKTEKEMNTLVICHTGDLEGKNVPKVGTLASVCKKLDLPIQTFQQIREVVPSVPNLYRIPYRSPEYEFYIQGTPEKKIFYTSLWLMHGNKEDDLDTVYHSLEKTLLHLIDQGARTISIPLLGRGKPIVLFEKMTAALLNVNDRVQTPESLKFIIYTNHRATLQIVNKNILFASAFRSCLSEMCQQLETVPRLKNTHIDMGISTIKSSLRNMPIKIGEDEGYLVASQTQILGLNARLIIEQIIKETVRWNQNAILEKKIKKVWQLGSQMEILRSNKKIPLSLYDQMKLIQGHGNNLQHSNSYWYLAELNPIELVVPLVKCLEIGLNQGILV